MTTQDWLPELLDEPSRPPSSRRRWLAAGALATACALVAVVVVVDDLTTAPPTGSAAATSPSGTTDTTAARPAPAPVVIETELTDPGITGGWDMGRLTVSTEPIQGGVAPERVPNFDSCQADRATLQYLPVEVGVPYGEPLGAKISVETTASTPPGIGRLGFFFQAGRESTPCPGGVWPTSDTFLANLSQSHIVGYIVLDQAFSASTPRGRSDVLRSLQLRVSDIRASGRPVTVAPPTAGSLCPGTSNELCTPLA
jgi:hypothetical protein